LNAEVPPPALLAPPKNFEPPKSEVIPLKKLDVVMKPPSSELIIDKKEDLHVSKEVLIKYPPKEDY
jgi:hypothetical protein